jgi:hypothetical protein
MPADTGDGRPSIESRLRRLLAEGKAFPVGHPQRRVMANRIVRLIERSNRLYRASGSDAAFYEDALMVMWRHFWRNLWEATTAEGSYCELDCDVFARLNAYLRRRVQDLAVKARAEANLRSRPLQDHELGDWVDPIDQLPAPVSEPQDVRSELLDWLVVDEDMNRVHVRAKPEVTAAWLVREYLLADRKWREVSVMADVSISTLSSFYERECRPRLQVFCREQGYC